MSGMRRAKGSEQSGGAGLSPSSISSGIETTTPRRTASAPAAKSTIALAVAAAAHTTPTPITSITSGVVSSSAGPNSTKTSANGQPATNKGKLVFGLSSRTNKVKHDEYAEKRGAAQRQQQALVEPKSEAKTPIDSNRSNPILSQEPNETGSKESTELASTLGNNLPEKQLDVQVKSGKIRASKYGNFYKPQDLVSSKTNSPAVVDEPPSSSSSNPITNRASRSPTRKPSTHSTVTTSRSKSPAAKALNVQQPQQQTTTTTTTTVTSSRPKSGTRKSSPARQKTAEIYGEKSLIDTQVPSSNIVLESLKTQQTVIAPKQINMKDNSQKVTGSSEQGPEIKESSSAATKNAPQTTTTTTNTTPTSQATKKMQFNIPPPPQLSTSSGIKPGGSVVSYAKSRIYDKPTRQQMLSNNILQGGESMLNSGAIPAAILSGFKPPKQVDVSKAREKWEGGEPFAKCKSRQRLAAQANKKLLHGVWSMSSVVATQQMQLQQVMSNSRLGGQKNDPPVKILTRGSVLERVQQYEKSPSSSGSTSGGSSSSSSSSSGSSSPGCDGLNDENDPGPELMAAVSAAAMPETTATEAGLALQQPLEPAELRPSSPTSKQAIYKTRVSSIQTSGVQPQDPLAMIALKGPQSPSAGVVNQMRRPSFGLARRRSSTASNSSIPKFYHPNGKPNTYEIELQKKNIVACFDKFPDRKAMITGSNYRRHFHSIALACGFSEYFKEPLYLYVKHQMTQSNLLHNTSLAKRPQRQSGVGPGMINGTSVALYERPSNDTSLIQKQPAQGARTLVKAASIDNSTMEKIQNQTFITCDQFLVCWRQLIATAFDNYSRFVHLLTFGQRNYLIPDDFISLIQSIIDDHPGLKFLRSAPDFHMRYIQTVIARIYFCINKSWTGKINLAELRRSNLLAVLEVLSQEEDINQITDYFSYEHFYVIYCKFWSLDQDHDLWISKEDLAKHNDAAISSRIIDRIFMGVVSKQIQATGKMSFSDFVWFLLAEEDKKHPRSIEYWFRLMDIDGDGYISMYEMEYFYYEQTKRLELMNIEALPFIDSACQILDLVNPKEKNKISLADLKRTKMATIFFDTFINLEKYLEHESREFVSTRDVVQDGVVISDWDRYASEEYESLVSEESSV